KPGLCFAHAASLLARHRMPADESSPLDSLRGSRDDRGFRGTCVGDQRSWINMMIDLIERREDPLNGLREINQIGLTGRVAQGQSFIEPASFERRLHRVGRADADDLACKSRLAQRERKRTAD